MSKLEELIQKLCPNGVEYKKLGDIGQVKMCKRILKSQTNTIGGIPFYKIGTFGGEANSFISKELYEEYKEKYSYPKIGEILISAAGTIGRTVVYDGEPAYYQDSNIVWLSHNESDVLNTFLRYCYELKPWSISSGGTIPRLYNDNILKAKIPVPPLEVQQEIVRLLDDFTAKTAELQAELNKEYEARKKQYEYYRDTLLMQKSLFINNTKVIDFLHDIELICSKANVLLSKDSEIKEQQCSYYKEIIKTYNETGKIPSSLEQTKKMSIIKIIQYLYGYVNVNLLDVANNYTGLTYKPSDKADNGTLVLRSSNIVNNRLAYDDNVFVQMENIPQRAIAKENDILVCVRNGSRALIGKSAIIPHTQTPMAFGAFMTVLRANPTLINYKYLYFVWQTNYVQNLIHGDEAMPINQITNKEFKRIHFALPTLNEQNALVQKLEKLEETSFELQSKISSEIESRQKQYEFYRDKLLTFKELNESEVN